MNSFLEQRQKRVADAWNLNDEIVLVGAGEPISIPGGQDQVYPFISHAEYFWLTDHDVVGGVMAFDPKDGWVDFVPDVTEAERVWEGKTDVDGTPLSMLAGWLASRRGRPIVNLGSSITGVRGDAGRADALREALTHARRPKDEVELDRMRKANAATATGYAVAEKMMRPGVTERQIQVEMEAGFFRNGGDRTAYGTIVGAASNSAVLHFSPTERALTPGCVVLIDAGAEYRRYASDITRTYRVPGGDAGFYRDLYQVVLGVEERGVARCVDGAEWRDVHLGAARELTEGLVNLGIMRGNVDALIEQDAHALFFPHGIGHMVGLGVRDASGYLPGRTRSTRPGLKNLRTDLPLKRDYVLTVEPGIYFIPALLQDPEKRSRYKDAVNWSKVDPLMDFGGIRIEDNARVTGGAPEILTAAVPKTLNA